MKKFLVLSLGLVTIAAVAQTMFDAHVIATCKQDTTTETECEVSSFTLIPIEDANAIIVLRLNRPPAPPAAGQVGFTASTAQTNETSGSVVLDVSRVGGTGALTVDYDTDDGTGVAGTDFTTTQGTLSWTAGETTATKQVTVPIINRPGVLQGNLTFTVDIVINMGSDTLTNALVTVTIGDADEAFPSGWSNTLINGGVRTIVSSSAAYTSASERFTVNHTGGEIWTTVDHFRAPTYAVASLADLTISACVVSLSSTDTHPKAGVMVRSTTNANSQNIFINMIGPDGDLGQRGSQRTTVAGTTSNPSYNSSTAVSAPRGYRLEIDGALESWKAYVSSSCSSPSWTQVDGGTATWLGTGDAVVAALASSPNDVDDSGTTSAAIFEPLTGVSYISTASVDHSGGGGASSISWTPTSGSLAEDGTTLTLTATRTGDFTNACSMFVNTVNGTAVGGTDFTAITNGGTISWSAGVGGTDTAAVTILDRAGVQGSRQFTVTLTTNACADGTVVSGTYTATITETDTPPAPTGGAWSAQSASGCSDGLGAFDAYIPGMRGFGVCNRGGFVQNTTVIRVSNTNTSGTGSFAAAATAGCPKVILFDVAGRVNTTSSTTMNRCTNWSVVGASAPGQFAITGSSGPQLSVGGNMGTVDHMVLAPGDGAGGDTGNRDAVTYASGISGQSDLLMINNGILWGMDETNQCYAPSVVEDITWWQNLVGVNVNTAHNLNWIMDDTCQQQAAIRNLLIHANGRHPIVRGDKIFWSNNLTHNPGFQSYLAQPCENTPSSTDVRMNIIHNIMVRGPNSDSHAYITGQSDSCLSGSLTVWETGNAVRNGNTGSIQNCASHACVSGISGFAGAEISAAKPTGYVPETFDTSDSTEILDIGTNILTFVGPRPLDRLTYIQSLVDEATNGLDGAGSMGSFASGTASEGGYTVLTDSGSWNPTEPGDINGHDCTMPTGSAANTIGMDGLTALHRWVIQCHYDRVMPEGYREYSLDND